MWTATRPNADSISLNSMASHTSLHPLLRRTGFATEWNLTEVPLEKRDAIKKHLASEYYESLRMALIAQGDDLDYPIVRDEDGCLRWMRDPLVETLQSVRVLNLNSPTLFGPQYLHIRRAVYKRLGFSLSGYRDAFVTASDESSEDE